MTEVHPFCAGAEARSHVRGAHAALVLARGLCLAAMPAFAIMALLAVVRGGEAMSIVCSIGPRSPLSGMAAMYLLMSVFHSPPWLKLIASR